MKRPLILDEAGMSHTSIFLMFSWFYVSEKCFCCSQEYICVLFLAGPGDLQGPSNLGCSVILYNCDFWFCIFVCKRYPQISLSFSQSGSWTYPYSTSYLQFHFQGMCDFLWCLGVYKSFIIPYNLRKKHKSTFLGAVELKFPLYTMGVMAVIKGCPNFNWLIWLDLGVFGLNEVCESVVCPHGLAEKAVYTFVQE